MIALIPIPPETLRQAGQSAEHLGPVATALCFLAGIALAGVFIAIVEWHYR